MSQSVLLGGGGGGGHAILCIDRWVETGFYGCNSELDKLVFR